MIDLARYESLTPAPRVIFDRLEERRTRVRFMVPHDGDYLAVTWQSYAGDIRNIGAFLAGGGFRHGGRAAIFGNNSVAWMTAAMAIQASGGVMVPIYPASTAAQAAYVLEHADIEVLFVDSGELLTRILSRLADLPKLARIVVLGADPNATQALRELRKTGTVVPSIEEVLTKVISFAAALGRGAAGDEQDPQAFDDRLARICLSDTAIMLYTSGTTGNPKGVPLTYRNVGQNGFDWLRCFHALVDEGYVDILWLPMSHIFGLGEAMIGDSLGWTTYLETPANVLRRLPQVKPDVFFSVPAYWEKMAGLVGQESSADRQRQQLAELTGGRLRFCLSGGAGLKREVKELFYRHGLLILEGYGLSECSPTLTLNRPTDFRFDSVGKPLPSVELRLAEDGEILARGPNVFGGYHKDPEATSACFNSEGWFLTGDIGRFTDDGFLQIIDRKKEILVTAGGKNVPPANIEQRFADEALVNHAVVYGDGKKFLVAGLWLDAETLAGELGADLGDPTRRAQRTAELADAAVARVNESLAKFEQIRKFCVMGTPLTVAGGLLTSTLKVRRKAVYEAFRSEFEALYEAP